MKSLVKTLIVVSVFLSSHTNAQEVQSDSVRTRRDTRPWNERISVGGATGFWIQPRQTHLELSLLLAYRFPKTFTVGPGYRYIYTRNRIYGKNLNSYGPNAFARVQLTKRLYLWTEYEYLNTEYVVELAGNELATKKDHVDSFYAGGGYIRRLGRKGRGGISIQVLYNFLYAREDNTPYYSPVIYRIGYFF